MPQCKFSLYLKKAGLASRNIVHFLKKVILRCIGLCFNYHQIILPVGFHGPISFSRKAAAETVASSLYNCHTLLCNDQVEFIMQNQALTHANSVNAGACRRVGVPTFWNVAVHVIEYANQNQGGTFRVLDDLRSVTLGCVGSGASTPGSAWTACWFCSSIAWSACCFCSAGMSSAPGKDAVSLSAGSAG